MADIAAELACPFPVDVVAWRIGPTNQQKTKGQALCYIDARDVMNRLDEVCGIFGWQSEHSVIGSRTICRLSIRNPDTGEWISRTDGCGDTDIEAEKGAFSDALKRAAVAFGIGRYLYHLDCPWVDIEPAGKSHRIVQSEYPKLRRMLDGAHGREASEQPQEPSIGPAQKLRENLPAEAPRPPTESVPLPNPAEPPEMADKRRAADRGFFARESYIVAIDKTGVGSWGKHMLRLFRMASEEYPEETFKKLRADNASEFTAWEKKVAGVVVEHFRKQVAKFEADMFVRLSRERGK